MGNLLLFIIALLLLTEAFLGLPGSVLASIIVPGNMVEGTLSMTTNLANVGST
jgi:hypothetical protein